MNTQTIRGEAFAALHRRPTIFAIPNPWDAGSAKMLTALGFEALATTSAGLSFALGKPDGEGEADQSYRRRDDEGSQCVIELEEVQL